MGKMGLGLLCMGCLAKRGGSAGKEWRNEGRLRLNEGMVILWVCCDSLSGETKEWWFSEFPVFVFGFWEKFWVWCGWFFPGVWVCCGWMGCVVLFGF
jgi:hypothetical protein